METLILISILRKLVIEGEVFVGQVANFTEEMEAAGLCEHNIHLTEDGPLIPITKEEFEVIQRVMEL